MSFKEASVEDSIYTRTSAVIGDEAVQSLRDSSVIVFGVGGVGGFAVEALARSGVGRIAVVDMDTVAPSNLNRQIIATHSTIGMPKVEAIKQRIVDINPSCAVETHEIFYSEENADAIDLRSYDYVLDCIDSVKSKLYLIEESAKLGVPIISSMGTGNKLDPTRFQITDISKTYGDPLAKVVRCELRKRGINHLKVVFSDEEPKSIAGGRTPGSLAFVPSVAGLVMASAVVRDLIAKALPR